MKQTTISQTQRRWTRLPGCTGASHASGAGRLPDGELLAHASGFTLIELTIALAVIAILSAIATISFQTADRNALHNAALALQADLRYAQRMAMIEGRRWGVLFDVKANRYALYHKDPYETVKTVTLTNNVQLREANKPYMEYLPRGTGTHGMTIALSKGNFWQNLTTGVSGGRVEIKEMRRSADGSKPPDGS